MTIDAIIVGDWNTLSVNTADTARKFIPNNVDLNVFNEPFVGYNRSLNNGARKGKAGVIGFLNNDLIFNENWLNPLIEALEIYDSVSPWCPQTHHKWWGRIIPDAPVQSYEVGKCIAGWAIFMKRDTWVKIGGFDERLEFWCCDNSYAEQLKQHKLTHALVPESKVTHLLSQTLNKVNRQVTQQLTKDQVRRFNRLYGQNLFNLGQ